MAKTAGGVRGQYGREQQKLIALNNRMRQNPDDRSLYRSYQNQLERVIGLRSRL